MRGAKAQRLEQRIREQQRWIADHGTTLEGYIARYGSASDPKHYGDGGELIFAADKGALDALLAQRSKA